MNKKNLKNQPKLVPIKNADDADDNDSVVSQKMLYNIQQKLDKSAVLNGGFDRLFYKIDAIESNQATIVSKVDKIHDAIYDPDEGLFARISNNKAAQNESIAQVEKKVIEINAWKDQKSKNLDEIENSSDTLTTKLNSLENSVESLNTFKVTTIGLAKWLLAAGGGGIITIIFKVLYDYVIIK